MKVGAFNVRIVVAMVMALMGLLTFNVGMALYLPSTSGRWIVCLVFSVTYLVTVINIVMIQESGSWRKLTSYYFLIPLILLWWFTVRSDVLN